MISLPFSYFGKSLNSYFHLSSAPFVTSCLCASTGCPFPTFFINLTVIFVGLFPSWLFASSQVFSPEIFTFSGSRVFVTLNPFSAEPEITLL